MPVNWWKRTFAKLLFFQYSHFKQDNPQACSRLVKVFATISTLL